MVTQPSQQPSFAGHVGQTMPFAPGASAGPSDTFGINMFFNMPGNEPTSFDPFNLMFNGRIDGCVARVIGPRNSGKTALGMHVCTLLGARNMGGQRANIMFDGHRRNKGRPEPEALAHKYGCQMAGLYGASINTCDFDLLNLVQMKELNQDALELVNRCKLNADENEAFAAALYAMEQTPELKKVNGPGTLTLILDKLWPDAVKLYRDKYVREMLANEKYANNPSIDKLLVMELSSVESVLYAAHKVAQYMRELMLRSCIGDDQSLNTLMRQRFFAPDFTGLTDTDTVIMQSFIWRVKAAAVLRGDRALYYNIEIHDENYKMWRHLIYARSMSDYMKTIRGVEVFLMMFTHRLSDYRTVGSVKSQQYQLAQNMQDDISISFVAKQPESARSDITRQLEIENGEFDMLKGLKKEDRVWGLKLPDEPLRFVRVKLTSGVKEVSASNAANESVAITPASPRRLVTTRR